MGQVGSLAAQLPGLLVCSVLLGVSLDSRVSESVARFAPPFGGRSLCAGLGRPPSQVPLKAATRA